MRREPDAFGAGPHGETLALDDLTDRLGHVLVLARDEALLHLDDRHRGAEASVDLREFEADIAAADDDQMLGKAVEGEQRGIGQIRHLVDTRQGRRDGASADIDEDARRAQPLLADRNRIRRDKPHVTFDYCAALHATHPALDARAGIR